MGLNFLEVWDIDIIYHLFCKYRIIITHNIPKTNVFGINYRMYY